jgi:hypothetical protein
MSLVTVDRPMRRSCAGCGAKRWRDSTAPEVEQTSAEMGLDAWPGVIGAYFWTCRGCGDVAVEVVGSGC